MEQSIPPLLLHAATWATIAFGIGYLFEQAENVASSETRTAVSRWLNNLDPAGAVASWPTTFATIFDHVFGERHLSWRCFSRSCVASFASVAMVTLMWGVLYPDKFDIFIKSSSIGKNVFSLFFITAIFNLIPDYISLLETRYMINWMRRAHSVMRILAFLAIDFVATAAIGLVGIIGALMIVILFSNPSEIMRLKITEFFSEILELIQKLILPLSASSIVNLPIGIWFYAAFFTSVWVWLYVLSGSVVRLMEYLGIGINRLKFVLDIKNKPLRAIGFVSIVLFTIAYLVVMPFLIQ